jgi:UDP-glucose 4-epimerase
MKGSRVLITGGAGFIGSNLAHRCLEMGASVIIYDNLVRESGCNLYNLSDIRDSINFIQGDIQDFASLSKNIRSQDILFNCAGQTSHPISMKEPLVDIDVNCKGTITILEAARRYNPDLKIVHIGTSTQVGRMQYSPIDENHPEYPLDIYSANKMASEKYALIYAHAYQMRTTVVRVANTFGPRSNIASPNFGFVNYFIGLGLQNKEITVYGSGDQVRNISYVEDVVEALIDAALNEKSNGQAFFATSDQQHSLIKISQAITKIIGGWINQVEWPQDRKMIEVGDAVISNDKIKRWLGWKPGYDLENGLIKTKAYFTQCLDKYLEQSK